MGVKEIIDVLSGFVWGPFLLVPLLLLTGLFLTVRLHGLQFRQLFEGFRIAFVVRKETGAGDISHYEALTTALSATVGTGNIVGVATAISLGGPGALFWMWITGLVGMATKYAEALLSVRYRETDSVGDQVGGPMFYLAQGVRWKPMGRVLGWTFALFAAVAAFGIGNMVQSNSIADALNKSFAVPTWVTGLVVAGLLAAVVLGGIKSIGRFTAIFVPVMILVYIGSTLTIVLINAARLPDALHLVFATAFTGTATTGGFAGAGIALAVRYGVARGIFSNESGLGSSGIAAAAAQTKEPVRQALVSMTQTFIDTLIVCTMTGLCIITTGAWTSGQNGAPLVQLAFRSALPGEWGGWIVAVSLCLFAFSTIVGWSYYGDRSVEYLLGRKAVLPYRLLFVAAAFLGTVYSLELVWSVSDLLNGLMALPNLVGLILLSGIVVAETKKYFHETAERRK